MVLALLSESDLSLSDDLVESILEKVLDIVNCLICAISIILLSGYLYVGHFFADNDGCRFKRRWED